MKFLFIILISFYIHSSEIGFFKLTEKPIYLKKNLSSKISSSDELIGSSKKNEFLIISSKLKKKNKTYYEVNMKTRYMGMGKKEKNFTGFIESSLGVFYNNEEFSTESLKKLPENFPKELAKQILQKDKNIIINFEKSSLQKLKTKDFFLLYLLEGYYNQEGFGTYKNFSYLVKKENSGKFKIFDGRMILFQDSVEDIDLDEDGVPEIHQKIRVRTSVDTPNFYGYVNGKMTALSLTGNIDFKTKRVKILLPGLSPDDVKEKYKELIYKNGKFEEVK